MEDESSNDVVAMESEESQSSSMTAIVENNMVADRPLMQFFKRLIFNKHSQNTMLTNAQLEDILHKEFNFDLLSLHVLEVEIYVTVLKKYLKEWPMWDEFETTTKDLTETYEHDTFVNILGKRYKSLKTYLKANLEMAKELSADLVAKVKNSEKSKLKALPVMEEPRSSNSSDVVLEIQATRDQLNKLIYRQPHIGFNYTIFSVDDKTPPCHIRLNTLSLEAILNWWSVKITISLQTNSVFLTRETTHELEHFLVNLQERDKESCPPVNLNDQIQIKETKKVRQVVKKQILGCLDLLSKKHDAEMEGMATIIQYVKKDFECLPVIAAPAQYRRYLSKHPYVRYLYSEAETVDKIDKTKYDIQLQETISPMHQFSVGRIDTTLERSLPAQWLKVECVKCNVLYTGENLATELKQHFDEYHQVEPDWQCTNCQKKFPMALLAESWWSHKCNESTVNKKLGADCNLKADGGFSRSAN